MNGRVEDATVAIGRRGRTGFAAAALALACVGLVPVPATAAGPDGAWRDRAGARAGWIIADEPPGCGGIDVLADTFTEVRRGHVRGTMRAV